MEAETVLIHQLVNNFLLSDREKERLLTGNILQTAARKAMIALSGFENKYFNAQINPFNSVMYCNYLYWVSHLLYEDSETEIADKVYYLNKMLNSVELFYAVDLPDIWSCEHPGGGVMGRAVYGNYFYFYQGCTVGGNGVIGKEKYPTIGEHVTMFSDSKIIGESCIGNNVIISANTYIINADIPDNSMVFGQSPNLIIKPKK